MAGTMSARVVPSSWCRENPNRNSNACTMMTPPPIQTCPLSMPATRPGRMKSTSSVMRASFFICGVLCERISSPIILTRISTLLCLNATPFPS